MDSNQVWCLGTMGFSYSDWQGVFYPLGAKPGDYLHYYSRVFRAVELDSTFYAAPRESQVKRWAQATPPGFLFCAKTPQQITHELRLIDAVDDMKRFVAVMQHLEEKLGAVLLQMPPDFTSAERDAVERFLPSLPEGVRFAIEFRHRSWYTSETLELLKAYGVCWAATEYLQLPRDLFRTTDFLYVRWIGQHGRFQNHRAEQLDVSQSLADWKTRLPAEVPHVQRVFGFFNNDFAGFSPATCNRFKVMMGLPTNRFPAEEQGALF